MATIRTRAFLAKFQPALGPGFWLYLSVEITAMAGIMGTQMGLADTAIDPARGDEFGFKFCLFHRFCPVLGVS